jgi:hypothetical protein
VVRTMGGPEGRVPPLVQLWCVVWDPAQPGRPINVHAMCPQAFFAFLLALTSTSLVRYRLLAFNQSPSTRKSGPSTRDPADALRVERLTTALAPAVVR